MHRQGSVTRVMGIRSILRGLVREVLTLTPCFTGGAKERREGGVEIKGTIHNRKARGDKIMA